jgi:hypothetical protein
MARRQRRVHWKNYVTEKVECWTRIRHASDRNVAEVAVDDANGLFVRSPLDETEAAPRCSVTTDILVLVSLF